MRKIFLCSCLLLLFVKYSAAQEQYVEVVITDTLMVEPQQWFYFVNIEKEVVLEDITEVAIDTMPRTRAPQKKDTQRPQVIMQQNSLDELKALAVANGGQIMDESSGLTGYSPLSSRSYNADEPQEKTYFNVKFTSRAAIEKFVKAISNKKDVRAQLTGSFNPDLASFKEVLDAKIMDKAKQKAARLAQLSGRKAGNVILVSEVTGTENNVFKDFFEKIFQMEKNFGNAAWRAAMENMNDKIKLEQSLRVRFAMK